MRNIPDALRSQKKTVRSRYVLGRCLCQDKPYGTIIFTMISFRAYNNNFKLLSFLSFYIWTLTKLLYKHQSMFWIFGCFDIVIIISYRAFCVLHHIWLCSCHLCNLTLLLLFFVTNYPIRKNICQMVNYNWIMTIEREQKNFKSSICNQ